MEKLTKARYEQWLAQPDLCPELLEELTRYQNDENTISDCFYQELAFGTGGLRGVLGVGTNRMNRYTVAKATKGLSDYLTQVYPNPSCAIAYDSRHKSEEFARLVACVLADRHIKVHIYRELMPTPMLSFAVRHLGCSAGIVITASHNPAKYNGYKVYGPDGCQITIDAAKTIMTNIQNHEAFPLQVSTWEENLQKGSVQIIDELVEEAYQQAVRSVSVYTPQVPLHVVYSPLNGAGNRPVRKMLDSMQNVTVTVVSEQEHPNGAFPTCPYPNPEMKEAMHLVTQKLLQTGADFGLATDPDCDRVGAVVLDCQNEPRLINGNEMGCLLFAFICQMRKAQGTMPKHPVAVKTIVTTEMATAIANAYGVSLRNVLTGFKFIGEQIFELEKDGRKADYLFGFEESYGYLSGTFVRDKDAVNAAMLICEMMAYYKGQNQSILDVLASLQQTYGFYENALLSFSFEGQEGMAQMNALLDGVRQNKPKHFASLQVQKQTDYLLDDTGLPKSNVIALSLEKGCQVLLRPSGTEPKLKLYVTAVGNSEKESKTILETLVTACNDFIKTGCDLVQ